MQQICGFLRLWRENPQNWRIPKQNLRPISFIVCVSLLGDARREYRTQMFMSACPFRAIEYRKTKKLPSKGIRQCCGFSRLWRENPQICCIGIRQIYGFSRLWRKHPQICCIGIRQICVCVSLRSHHTNVFPRATLSPFRSSSQSSGFSWLKNPIHKNLSPQLGFWNTPYHPRIDNNRKVLFITLHYLTIFCLVSEACYILICITCTFFNSEYSANGILLLNED